MIYKKTIITLITIFSLMSVGWSLECEEGEVDLGWGHCSNYNENDILGYDNLGCMTSGCWSIEETTELYLPYSGLTGEIPSEIGNLVNLTVLHLFENPLTGEIPPEIGNLTNLISLDLWFCGELTGEIPSEIGNLTNLSDLWLSGNQFTGEIPPEICNLSDCQIYIDSNNLCPPYPDCGYGPITSVEEQNISECQFSCNEETEVQLWYECYNIEETTSLDLSNSGLTGEIPSEIGDLVNLTGLYLSSNELSGEIPPEIGNLENLNFLSLHSNQLTGEIPSEISNLQNLMFLHLFDNQLNGELPESMCDLNINWSNPGLFDISNNSLCPPYPECLINEEPFEDLDGDGIWDQSEFEDLNGNGILDDDEVWFDLDGDGIIDFEEPYNDINGNGIWNIEYYTGEQDTTNCCNYTTDIELWGVCYNIEETISLYLYDVYGEIPPEIGNLINLEQLTISSTQITGEIPPEIGNLINLNMLVLVDNNLTGEIPPEIGNLINLNMLVLVDNNLTGEIPPEIGNLTNLQVLGLEYNQLTGEIPPEIGDLENLSFLRLISNQLSGEIPSEIGNLVNLEVLQLKNNQLNGLLPLEICNLNLGWSLIDYGNELEFTVSTIFNNQLCPPYPECIEDYVGYQDISECVGYLLGDVNFDGDINLLDVIMGLQIILGNINPSTTESYVLDYNQDGFTDILDIINIVNLILYS